VAAAQPAKVRQSLQSHGFFFWGGGGVNKIHELVITSNKYKNSFKGLVTCGLRPDVARSDIR
jgi:hypothetical protein